MYIFKGHFEVIITTKAKIKSQYKKKKTCTVHMEVFKDPNLIQKTQAMPSCAQHRYGMCMIGTND